MFDIGFAELLVISVLALVILGPERLPHAIKTTLQWINYLRSSASNIKETVNKELKVNEIKQDLQLEELNKEVRSLKQEATLASGNPSKPSDSKIKAA
ncbi:Sec-independent protein translocase protein TatB [Endozoicomonas sp. 8E]|uniref:Sec-independent protein translocase protein TatB n=1 Tax=Endozoicomonas sp. 8E TaxID=3035692 RepID=UPI002938D005|nr:Sec-independent protein translocase protein TatB [Endozoicomonas sp. 8E]WOG28559.1 Sec-independent protein translocase protein TatB [Endozoicomonas sp. 8E]